MALVAGVLPVVGAGSAGAQSLNDPDSVQAGATDLGDVRSWRGSGVVTGRDDVVDYYKFSLSESRLLGVGLSALEFDADLYVEDLSVEDEDVVVRASSTRVSNQKEALTVVLEPGTYFVRVEAQHRGLNTYALKLDTAKPDSVTSSFDTSKLVSMVDDTDTRSAPNPRFLTAEKISPYWDIDWVRLELEANVVYVLEVRGKGSGSGTLIDPELKGVFVNPSDPDMFDAYRDAGRLRRDLDEQLRKRIRKKGLSPDDLSLENPSPDILLPEDGRIRNNGLLRAESEDYPSPPDGSGAAPFSDGYDLDDGLGQDAWLLFRPEKTGSHWIEVDSQGGFAGSYVIAVSHLDCYEKDHKKDSTPKCPAQPTEPEDDPRLVFSESSLNVREGATAMYALRLATEPTSPVTVAVSSGDTAALSVPSTSLTFETSNWDQPQSVTVRGVEDDDIANETVTVTHNASGGSYDAVTGTVTVTVTDDDTEALVLSESSLDVDEGATATYRLSLATEPTAAVTVTLSSSDSGAVTVPVSFVFTTSNWNQPRTVTVRGVEDEDTDDETVTVTHRASGGGYGSVTGTVTVTVTDDDTKALVLSPQQLSVDEGDTTTYRLSLATQPTAAVTVALSSSDSGALTVPTSFVFTTSNWDQPRTVTVRGVEDDDFSDETVTVTHNASRGGYGGVSGTVTVTVVDDDTEPPNLVLSPQQLSVDEGATATYRLSLATQPTGAVTVTVSSSDAGALSVPVSFVFTTSNWNQPRTVTVRGVEDEDTNNETVTVTHRSSGGGYGSVTGTVTVTVTDDDVQPPALVLSPQQLSVGEGDTATYRLSLATQPTGAVTVTVSSSDAGALSVPVSFVFTTSNWNQPRTVTVRGVEDEDTDDETVTVTHRSSGGGYGSLTATVAVSVIDDDTQAPGLVLSESSLNVDEGDTAAYTLRLATRPTGAVSVAVSLATRPTAASDAGALAVPGSFVFTASNWNQPRTVTVRGVEDEDTDDETVTVTHRAVGGGYGSLTATVAVSVIDDDTQAPGLVLSPQQLSVDEGDTAAYTLRLATRPTGAVSVAVSSSDSAALAVPGSFVFTTSNWNQPRTVTVRGVEDEDTDNETVTVTHNASRGGYSGVSGTVTVTVTDDDARPPALVLSPQQLSVGEGATATYTLRLATQPTAAVSVAVSSGDSAALSVPVSFVFTTSNWDQPRTVTVRGVEDEDTNNETVTVTHRSSGGGYGSVSGTVTVTVTDDDVLPPNLVFSPQQLSVGEGATATYRLSLATQPTAAVTVTVSSGDSAALSVPVSFVFTTSNWDQPRTVTVRGVEDEDTNNETVTVTHRSSGGGYGSR